MYMRRFIKGLLDIVFPPVCLVCRRRLSANAVDNTVCSACWGAIRKNIPPFCHSCGRHLDVKRSAKNICQSCMKHALHFDRAVSPCRYDGTVKELIHAFKYGNKPHVGGTLSRLMIGFIEEYDIFIDIIDAVVPMPLHNARMREREFNQAAVLGGHIAGRFNKPLSPEILIRKRATGTQTGLETEQRFSNVRGCFQVREPEAIRGKNILLVDDVLTTGATASEAALALKENGARVVLVITAAC